MSASFEVPTPQVVCSATIVKTDRISTWLPYEHAGALAGCRLQRIVKVHVQGSPWARPMQPSSSLTIDEALQGSVGEYGRGQIYVLALTSLTSVVAALINFSFAFTSIDPFIASIPECLPSAGEVCDAQKPAGSQFCAVARNSWEWRYRYILTQLAILTSRKHTV